ncbi:MAG TPA: diguanylate cyclase [Xanthobacteraceae bacterium]|nr:diguanylate cyclase [Xanthobacteraceae bacterium]
MAERRAGLAFPEWLEREFQADRRGARCRLLAVNARELIAVYNLFLAADWFLTPDTWFLAAFLHLAIVTPWMLGALWLYPRLSASLREAAAASLSILVALQILLIYALSRSPGAVYYQNLVLLVILNANTIQRLPYRLAIAVSCFVVITHAGFVLSLGATPLAAGCLSSAMAVASAYITLSANRLLERDERRNYLQTLRDRLVHEQTEAQARRDPLTGLANRRELQNRLEALWAQNAATTSVVGILMLDIDHFKAYNDRYGHPAGDACLKRVASCIQGELRGTDDLAARYGGEEMLVVLPNADVGAAVAVAERIRRRLESLGIPHELAGVNRVVTASLGAASAPAQTVTADELVAAADAALYAAKSNGRNQVFPPLIRPSGSVNRVTPLKPASMAG